MEKTQVLVLQEVLGWEQMGTLRKVRDEGELGKNTLEVEYLKNETKTIIQRRLLKKTTEDEECNIKVTAHQGRPWGQENVG